MEKEQLEKALEDTGTLQGGSCHLAPAGNIQHYSSEPVAIQLENRYEAVESDKDPTLVAG